MNKVILEFESGNSSLFPRLQQLSEMRSNTHQIEKLIVTSEDKEVVRPYFDLAVTKLSNILGWTNRVKNLEGTLVYTLSDEEKERGFEILIPLIERAIIHHMMYQWLADHTAYELAGAENQLFTDLAREIQDSAVQPGVVERPYRPYF